MGGGNSGSDRTWDDGSEHVLPRDSDEPLVLQRAAPRAIEWAAERLASGGVIALPTDTVYGIAASLAHAAAIRRIYDVKRRPHDRPLPVLVSSTDALLRIASVDEHVAYLLDQFWPGPLTVVVAARAGMPDGVLGADGTVAVRMPNHPLAIEVIEKAGGAVACTSANFTGEPPATTTAEVVASVGPALDLILDGGRAPGGIPSTVIAVTGREIVVLRDGAIAGVDVCRAWETICAAHPAK
ncbi:MAG: L-threonylcarbamoyladenylate synthase [Thermomicrobiales bacterium]